MHSTEWTEAKVLELVIQELQGGLPIEWEGRDYGPTDVWQTLVGSACQGLSISQQTRTSEGGPHGNTVMYILRQQSWWKLSKIEPAGNRLLQSSAGDLGPGPVTLAIDLHHQSYYGKKQGVVCGGEKKQGTNKFFSYATAYVIRPHREVTLAITVVEPGDKIVEIVARLLAYLDPLDLWVDRILMDREFFATEVIELLQGCGCPCIIPVKRTGDPKRNNGTQPLFRWEISAWTPWQLRRSGKDHVHFDVAIVDLSMPEMDGIQLFERLRQLDSGLQVIMLTGHATIDTAIESVKAGALDYLTKPFDFERLRGLLKHYEPKAA